MPDNTVSNRLGRELFMVFGYSIFAFMSEFCATISREFVKRTNTCQKHYLEYETPKLMCGDCHDERATKDLKYILKG